MSLSVQVGRRSIVGEDYGSMLLLLKSKTRGKQGEEVLGTS